ncbi:MAG TPA: hypothetical protein DIU15_07740 [Deltaproteobacteria bacterium]|nr:hypothetical protein [Deltaproteobacteria bacterium]HCP45917.1 hypothetical protein [Deltaproteobacteria bacterium]
MKLQVTFETDSPSRLEGLEGAVAIVYQDDRPLRGLAVRADWRLNGFLSRLVVEERFQGEPDEWLLVHTQGRLPYTHLFLVGMGRRGDHTEGRARRTLETVAGKVALAGLHALAINLSEVVGDTMPMDDAMFLFLEGLSKNYPDDDLSDPPYRPALDAKQRNEERLQAFRDRRQELVRAREEWDRVQEDAADSQELDDEVGEETLLDEAGDLPSAQEADSGSDSLRQASGATEEQRSRRPVAGALPPELDDSHVAAQASDMHAEEGDSPPDPGSLAEPELEPAPERTVHVVLVGDAESLSPMRKALRESGGDASASLAVEWSR